MAPYNLADRLVVGVSSSALFDLAECDQVFRDSGPQAYRDFQRARLDVPLRPGVAFPLIRGLLSLNALAEPDDPLVEVIIMSRNSPETGVRVMRSIRHHGLGISRAIFTEGTAPYRFAPALSASLFLSANGADVRAAAHAGLPAGQVLGPQPGEAGLGDPAGEDPGAGLHEDPGAGRHAEHVGQHEELRLAFDFDGVIADRSSERVFAEGGLASFQEHERDHADRPMAAGPLMGFLGRLSRIQQQAGSAADANGGAGPRVRISVITARSAPAHERALRTLDAWGIKVNDAFFLGGIDKGAIAQVLRPHVFFDDQLVHLSSTSRYAPSVLVPPSETVWPLPSSGASPSAPSALEVPVGSAPVPELAAARASASA